MPTPTKTSIQRSWKSTLNSLLIACISAVIALLLFIYIARGPVTIGIACIPAIIALIFIYSAVSGAGEAPCPSCAKPVTGLSTANNDGILCPHCKNYLEGKNGELQTTDPNRIADAPLFSSPLPEKFTFPPVCCVCGNPSTQTIKVSMTTTNASSALTQSTIGVTSSTITSVEVPHCADHKNGAALTGTKTDTKIRFRSYPYLRAFCEANNTTPA